MPKRLSKLYALIPFTKIEDGSWFKLSQTAQQLFVILAKHKNFNTRLAFPSNYTINKYFGYDVGGSAIVKAREELVNAGFIRVLPKKTRTVYCEIIV